MTTIRLSEKQNSVVEHVDGPLLVVAGPGSGKTRVLTERVRHLLTSIPGHFRILALTFTNKAANEMNERLSDLGDARRRAFIGTLHSFCLEMLSDRGKPVGVDGVPAIFESQKDRKEILLEAVVQDPLLSAELDQIPNAKDRNRQLDRWLRSISWLKAHPVTIEASIDELSMRVLDAYDAGLRASGAYDFDDLLLLAYRLLSEYPQIADFYRRLYTFICIDEAQDLNEAQYAVLTALCGDSYRNVMMVGDPKQSIYGFNTSSPDFMWRFSRDFNAPEVELTENFRSSRAVVAVAQSLEPSYMVEAQLPIAGMAAIMIGKDEEEEAELIVSEIRRLVAEGHEDIEGGVSFSDCAVLGRTRFALMKVEAELERNNIPYYKRLMAGRDNESNVFGDFELALRVLANPRDRLHLAALAKRWRLPERREGLQEEPVATLERMSSESPVEHAGAVTSAISAVARPSKRLDLMPGFRILKAYADSLAEEDRLAIYEDAAVLTQEWDQYLRSSSTGGSIGGFLSSRALGTTQQAAKEGVALLTVHSSKGLEFDVIFVAGMAEGVFPDYRALGNAKAMQEEARNAFVAVTRSRRLLYLTYPRVRTMPWGDSKGQRPSRYLEASGLLDEA